MTYLALKASWRSLGQVHRSIPPPETNSPIVEVANIVTVKGHQLTMLSLTPAFLGKETKVCSLMTMKYWSKTLAYHFEERRHCNIHTLYILNFPSVLEALLQC